MLVLVSCPECGHLGQVPEKRLGHKVRCKGCGVTFRPKSAAVQASAETKKGSGKDRPDKKPAGTESAWLGLLKQPALIDGAAMGAIAGVLTGVIIGAVTEVIYAEPRKGILYESIEHSSVGTAIGGGIKGFITGVIAGSLIGALLGLVSVYFQSSTHPLPSEENKERGWARIVGFGILIGASVTAIMLAMFTGSHYQWLAAGAFVGALGGLLWLRLQTWEQASDQPIVGSFQLEEDEKPSKTTGNIGQEDEDRGLWIDDR